MAVQVAGEVVDVRRAGAYHVLAVAAPGVAEETLPGHFVALAVGGEDSALLLRRAFSVYRAQRRGASGGPGVPGGTVEVVVSAHGPGTRWLAARRRGDAVDVVGPLGRPFRLPEGPTACAVVGGGYGAAPLVALAERLRERGCRVDAVLGAADEARLFGVVEVRRAATTLTVTTDDGSAGLRGRVTDALPRVLAEGGARTVFACGPMPMLAAVARAAAGAGADSQCAVEEAMACGVGVCMSCVLPVVGDDGATRMVRSCVEGPVLDGARVRWADVGTVPDDCLGAPRPAGPPAAGAVR